ncbi:uncharacterized protein [Physcomitrium patens]|nr:peptidyl-prolyl cis-trans isomerase E-like [Physcomitrium patens]XP_024376396.1 peptidyl-prolyl cis-trans isomerase E-like [Physcomitrium patens]|eukprot:XP_024376395.1 peptidyl-prolyl cis-trans isomerase E-like [Physcomitrella patens]
MAKSTMKKGSKVVVAPPVDTDSPPPKGVEGEALPEQIRPEPEPERDPDPDPDPNPLVYFDVQMEHELIGRIWFELFKRVVPKTVENFRGLCTGEYGVGTSGACRWYRNSQLFRTIPGFCLQGGDFMNNNGTGGESIYGELFDDENFELKHEALVLSMANSGPNSNGSQYFITLKECPWLDGRHVVFGKVIKGEDVVRKIEANGTRRGTQKRYPVKIKDCGQMPLNTENNPTRPNWLTGRILPEGPQFARLLNLPRPDRYLPSIWRRKNNSVTPDMRRRMKDMQVCLDKQQDLRLQLFPHKRIMHIDGKRRPLNAIGTKRHCIINPFSMERNLSFRWKISPFAQNDRDKPLRPSLGLTEVPDELTMRRLSQLMLGQGAKPGDVVVPAA